MWHVISCWRQVNYQIDSLIIFGLAEMEFELGNFEQAIQYYAKFR